MQNMSIRLCTIDGKNNSRNCLTRFSRFLLLSMVAVLVTSKSKIMSHFSVGKTHGPVVVGWDVVVVVVVD